MFLRSKKGYTLIELLIVIGIMAVLLSIAVPVISGVITSSRLKLDKDLAKSYETSITLWMSEEYSDQIVYTQNLNTSNFVGVSHNELSYSKAYMGTQQLPGIEFTNATDIRNATISAMKSLTKDEIETHNIDDLYLHHPKSTGYGYKYYYRAGVISVERTDSFANAYTGTGYEYFIWLDYNPMSTQQVATTGIKKFEKQATSTGVNKNNEMFSFKFSIENGESVSKCVYSIENENCSYTLSGKNQTPQVFIEGQYTIKFYYNGEMRYNGVIEVSSLDVIDNIVSVSFSNNSLQFSTSETYFTSSGSVLTGLKPEYKDTEGTLVIPPKINGFTITEIGESAFSGCKASKIILPSSISKINKNAFNGCTLLEYISLPSPTLSERSIVGCSKLKTIEFYIPGDATDSTIRSIDKNAISSCSSLTNLSFTSVYRNFSNVAFQDILTQNPSIEISIAATKNDCPSSFTNNARIKYDFSPKDTFVINAPVLKVNINHTPDGSGKLHIPHRINKTVSEVKSSSDMYLLNKIAGSISYTSTEIKQLANFRTIYNELIIDDGYITVEPEAFEGFKFTTISLPSTLKTIGQEAFAGNSCLSIEIPESVTAVGAKAFASDTLQTISVRCDISSLTSNSLVGCTRVTTMIIYNFDGDKSSIKPEQFGLNENVKIVFM